MSTSDLTLVLPIDHKNVHHPGADRDIALLNRTAIHISKAGPLQEALGHLVNFVTTVMTCDSCMVYVLECNELVLQGSKAVHRDIVGRVRMKMGEGITGWVAENRQPVAIADHAYEDFRFKLFNELPEDRFESFLSVPMVSGGRLVGIINVQNRARYQFSEREINLIATIGFLVGAEIERARLQSDNSAILEKLETRTLVDRAKAILQRSLNLGEEKVYRIMQRESQDRNKSMRKIAEAVILIDELKQPASKLKSRSGSRS
jgi:uroporphyrinogen-III synthase